MPTHRDTLNELTRRIEEINLKVRDLLLARDAELLSEAEDTDKSDARIELIDRKIAVLNARKAVHQARKQRAEDDLRDARRNERMAASESTRRAVLDAVASRCADDGIAAELGAAMARVLDLAARYAADGRTIQRDVQAVVAAIHHESPSRAADTMLLAGSRALGNSPVTAVPVYLFIKQLVRTFGDQHLGEYVSINALAPKAPANLLDAARIDAEFLIDRLQPLPAAKPQELFHTWPPAAAKIDPLEQWHKAMQTPDTDMTRPLPLQGLQRDDLGPAHQSNWAKAIGSAA